MNKFWLTSLLLLSPGSAFAVNGAMGIGVVTPLKKLHVGGAATGLAHFEGTGSTPDAPSNATVQVSDGAGGTHYGVYVTSKGTGISTALYASSQGTGTNYAAIMPSGNVGIGTTVPAYPLHVVGSDGTALIMSHGNTAWPVYGQSTIGGSSGYGVIGTGGSYWAGLGRADGYAFVGIGAVWATGAGLFNQSDGRLKERVENLNEPLETLMKLRPVSYHWKPNSEAFKSIGSARQFGLIAQEVKEVLPEIVLLNKKPPTSPNENGEPSLDEELGESFGVEYTKIIPFLIGGLKEAWGKLQAFVLDQGRVNAELKRELLKLKQSNQKRRADNAALKQLLCQKLPEAQICLAGR